MSSRPNFLMFITDQQRADHVGCYGNGVLRTPHIDLLAARGTRFDRFYVATGICMPKRAHRTLGRRLRGLAAALLLDGTELAAPL